MVRHCGRAGRSRHGCGLLPQTRATAAGSGRRVPGRTGLVAPPDRPLGADVEPIELPPLDETDTLVRQLVGALSSHPGVVAWLATNGLIRNFVVAVENISIGRTPAGRLRPLRPTGAFRVVERGEERVIDPGSYERYTPIAGAVQSVDAAGAARL